MGHTQRISKTNAMRELDQHQMTYQVHHYEVDPSDLSGITVAAKLSKSYDEVYKSLVVCLDGIPSHESLRSRVSEMRYGICLIPVDATLDCKKAAASFGVKHASMLPLKQLQQVTGYIRGGCTPLALKKPLMTVIHEDAQLLDTFCISAGKRGMQLELSPNDLVHVVSASFSDIVLAS